MTKVLVSGASVAVKVDAPRVSATVAASPVRTAKVSAPTRSVSVTAPAISATARQNSVGVVAVRGPAGASGGSGVAAYLTALTAGPIGGHFVVTVDDTGHMVTASADDIEQAARPLAMTTGAWPAGDEATAQLMGLITEPSWNWIVGLPIWLGVNGLPTQILPPEAVFQRQVAEVVTPTTIFVDVKQAIVLA